MKPVIRLALLGLAAGLVIDAALLFFQAITRPPVRGTGSSYVTGPGGLDDWADILEAGGHDVDRQRRPFDLAPPPSGATVIVAETELDDEEAAPLRHHVATGGRVVLIGEHASQNATAVTGLFVVELGDSPTYVAKPAAATPEVAGVREIEVASGRTLNPDERFTVLLQCNGSVLAEGVRLGRGEVIVMPDGTAFQNGLIAARDNTVLAQSIVGPAHPVVFAEQHGEFAQASGLAGFPARVKIALALIVAAGGLAVLAQRRDSTPAAPVVTGGAETARGLADRLSEFAGAAQIAQVEARGLVLRAARLPVNASPTQAADAARQLGLSDAAVGALYRPVTDRDLRVLADAIQMLRSPTTPT